MALQRSKLAFIRGVESRDVIPKYLKEGATRYERLQKEGQISFPRPFFERKQIYLPDFTITLIRTPFLPPRYASFWVPLTFNKLDIKDYLWRAYNVRTLKVRSSVHQQKLTRERPRGRLGHGPLRRPTSWKKMTVEMTEPFVWPEQPEDLSSWDRERFYEAEKLQDEFTDSTSPDAKKKPPERKREMFAEQAKLVKEGKETWKPTWQALGLNFDRPVVGRKEE